MADWYRTHDLSPEAYPDSEYRSWAQDNGLHVDAAGSVDYGSSQTAEPDIFLPPADPGVYGGWEECPACASDRSHRGYVPGHSGMPVECGSDWHDEDAKGPGDA